MTTEKIIGRWDSLYNSELSKRFDNLVMSQSEQRKIDAANNARPTNMASNDTSLDGLGDALGLTDEKSDLPF